MLNRSSGAERAVTCFGKVAVPIVSSTFVAYLY